MKLNQSFKKAYSFFTILTRCICIQVLLISNGLMLIGQTPDLFITCNQTDVVGRFDGATGAFLGNFVTPGSGGLDRPQEVFFHPVTRHLLVTGFVNSKIKMYDGETGAFISDFNTGYNLSSPTKMILGSDSLIYVTQWGGKVVRFTLDGDFVDEFSSIDIPAGLGMVWDDDDNLYVTSWGTNGFDGQVYKFDSEGNSQGAFINSDILEGPVGIWRDNAGNFYVVDWRLGSVLRFDSAGNFIDTFISGTERTEGHAFRSDGAILLCNVSISQVKRYNADGSFNEIFINGGLAGPNAITFGPSMITPTDHINLKKEVNLQAFPNPFLEQTNIQFQLPTSTFVAVKIVNNVQQEIAQLQEGILSAGQHQVEWNASGWPAGIYFVQLTIENEVFIERVVLSK